MRPSTHTGGFSMIEFVVATLAAAVLALTAGSMLYYGYLTWVKNSEAVEVQRDATAALRMISEHVREASDARTTVPSPGVLRIAPTNTFTDPTVQFYDNGAGDLMFDPDTSSGGDEVTLVENRLAVFTPIKYPPGSPVGVRVSISLIGGSETTGVSAVTTFRNSL
ncbi:MAG: hypothetical protein KJ626_00585 [Verrucomicrobia bacterium]|nr:hypothetical protein [Verrucomicrobiota bacterium]